MSNVTLLHGDCMVEMKSIADKSVDLVLCDPPYGTTLMKWDNILPFGPLWEEYTRVLAPGGCVILFGSQPFTSALVMSRPEWFKYEIIWNKNKCGSPGLAKVRPMKVHENILVFAPGRTVYNPQMEEGTPYYRKSREPSGYVGRVNNHAYGLKPRTEFSNDGTRYPKSILNISRDFSAQQQIHPTQKPVPLLEWLILTYSHEGGVVLDNTMGSGSTGIAAVNTQRKFIGIEQDEDYFTKALDRIFTHVENKKKGKKKNG